MSPLPYYHDLIASEKVALDGEEGRPLELAEISAGPRRWADDSVESGSRPPEEYVLEPDVTIALDLSPRAFVAGIVLKEELRRDWCTRL